MQKVYGDVTDQSKRVLDEFFMREGINAGTFLEALAEELRARRNPVTKRLLDRARKITFERGRRPKP